MTQPWHMANWRQRTYRGPIRTVKPVGDRADDIMRRNNRGRIMTGDETCVDCGYHVCGCRQAEPASGLALKEGLIFELPENARVSTYMPPDPLLNAFYAALTVRSRIHMESKPTVGPRAEEGFADLQKRWDAMVNEQIGPTRSGGTLRFERVMGFDPSLEKEQLAQHEFLMRNPSCPSHGTAFRSGCQSCSELCIAHVARGGL